MFRILLSLLPFLALEALPAVGDPPKVDPPVPDPPKPEEITFDAKQQQKVNDLIAAAKKKAEGDTATRLKNEATAAKAATDAEAERTRQEAAGEFDKVKKSLSDERDSAATERDGLKGRVETLEKLATDRLTALLEALPKEIAELGPDEDTPIEKRLEWAERAAKAAGIANPSKPGNGPNPQPAGGKKLEIPSAVPKRQLFN